MFWQPFAHQSDQSLQECGENMFDKISCRGQQNRLLVAKVTVTIILPLHILVNGYSTTEKHSTPVLTRFVAGRLVRIAQVSLESVKKLERQYRALDRMETKNKGGVER